MDIALFVGFASSGPIGIPVVLETAEEFNAIFGKDLPLVWNREKAGMVYAYLAPTVRAFFRNGGKRCWVIRTARLQPSIQKPLNRACYNFFPLSGMACIQFSEKAIPDIMPAVVRARSKGSWSDGLQIGTAALARAVKFLSITHDAGQKVVRLEVPANDPLKTGELLRLDFSQDGSVLFLAADRIEDGAEEDSPPVAPVGKLTVKVTSKRFVWLENLPPVVSPEDPPQKIWLRMWTEPNPFDLENIPKTFLLKREAEMSIVPQESEGNEDVPPKVKLEFTGPWSKNIPRAGSLLVSNIKKDESLLMQVETVNAGDPKKKVDVEITCRAVIYRKRGGNPQTATKVERLSFELWIKKNERSFIKLSDLAFDPGHERFWGNLPTDDDRYTFPENAGKDAPEIPSWTQTGDSSNFPIAGNGDRAGFYFPLFSTAVPESYLGKLFLPGTKLQRDGLEEFDAALFLDEKLKNTGLNNLLNEGEFIRYLSPRPRPLWGIHSALVPETTTNIAAGSTPTNPVYTSRSLDEATIISIPDAAHLAWYKEEDQREVSPPLPSLPPERPEWWRFQDCRNPDIKRVSEPELGNFLDCSIRVIDIPEHFSVKEGEISAGKFTLIWESREVPVATSQSEEEEFPRFVLEESTTPGFQFPQKIYAGKDPEFEISGRAAGIFYYRVRAEISAREISDWSEGRPVKIPAAENWVAKSVDKQIPDDSIKKYNPDVLFAVQRALLRMCAARGDLFAVLDLPEHYDKDDAIKHIATLKATKAFTPAILGVEPFSADETKALSFGAAYHPWLMTREGGFKAMRNIPASGAICGVMAHRAIQRGAWIAPANESLQGVLGLATAFARENFLDFQDGLINLIRHEPTGFFVLDSDTLSDDSDLRSINVRRLLSLLRRLALKRGAEYVFEPNDERFRRRVQRGFASLLDMMFTRGAFAGTTPATSYQVVVSDSVNNFQSLEQGRLIVELRVAPSQPLKFVTVRLMQAGGRSSVTEVF